MKSPLPLFKRRKTARVTRKRFFLGILFGLSSGAADAEKLQTSTATGQKIQQMRGSVQWLGLSHLTVIRTHTLLITSFPVLRGIIKDNKLCVKDIFFLYLVALYLHRE